MGEAGGSAGSGTTKGTTLPAAVVERAAARYGSIHTRWGRSQPWGTAASTLADRSAVSTSLIVEVGSAEEMPRLQRDAPERPRLALLDESSPEVAEVAPVALDVAERIPSPEPNGAERGASELPAARVVREPPPFPGYATLAQIATVAEAADEAEDSVDGGETPRTSRSPRVWVLAAAVFAVAAALVPGAPGPDPEETRHAPRELAPRATTHALRPRSDQPSPQPAQTHPSQRDEPTGDGPKPPVPEQGAIADSPTAATSLSHEPGAASEARLVGGPGRAEEPAVVGATAPSKAPAGPVEAAPQSRPRAARPASGAASAASKRPKPAKKLRSRGQKAPRSGVSGGIIRDSPF